jgi:hypothetical protein
MSIKRITVAVFQTESIEDFDLLKDLNVAVVLEKRHSIDQQVMIQRLVVVPILAQVMIQRLVVVLVQVVANYHQDKQEF